MGRVKLEIKKIENTNNRLVTFAKRKAGLIKKAQELATLCDIDVALIMFSPGNKLTQYATNSRIEEIITRYANVPEAERFKRKMENMQQLNRAIRKLKGEDQPSFHPPFKGEFSMEYVQRERNKLQNEIESAQTRLRLYQGDDEALDMLTYEELSQMELHVQAIMEKVHLRKQDMFVVDYNMKEAWLQPKDVDLSHMIKVFKEHSENPGIYAEQVPYHMMNPGLDLNQQAGGDSTGFVRFSSHPALTQPEPFFMESVGQSIVHDNAENYPPFTILESEFDCQEPPAPPAEVESSSK